MNFISITQSAPPLILKKLEDLKGLRERPDYHPEPSTFHHIEIVVNRLVPTGDFDLIMAGVLHDICKLDCARVNPKNGHSTSPGHDKAAYDLIMETPSVQDWIRGFGADPVKVAGICMSHMRFHILGQMREGKRNKQIQDWKDQGIWDQLAIHGAADNMIEDFDLDNVEKSWKWKR